MNTAIHVSFATPYISSITRDQYYVHSPMPLDGAIASAIYWEATANNEAAIPTFGQADHESMDRVVYPELGRIFKSVTVGEILSDLYLTDEIFLVSSGFPVDGGEAYIRRGAQYIGLVSGQPLTPEYDTQPIRRRVYPQRLASLNIHVVTKIGKASKEGIDTSRGGLKGIDNKLITWAVFEMVWFAQVLDPKRLRELLQILKFQGMGKKRSAGFGKVVDFRVEPFGGLDIEREVFATQGDQLVLLRPLPYDAVRRTANRVVMTNLMVEYGCGARPPYWSDRRVVVREGTIFRFLN